MSENNFLVIDDNEVFAGTLARGLERRGYAVQQAHDKEAALRLAAGGKFQFITVDLHLGEDSGLSLIAPLCDLQPDARILVLTGYASIATAVQAVKEGADNYLAKPANVESILPRCRPTRPKCRPTKRSRIRSCCRSTGSNGSTSSACWPRTTTIFQRPRVR